MIELYLDVINDKSYTWKVGRDCDCDKPNISVVICETDKP
jgi:hypothetical protein